MLTILAWTVLRSRLLTVVGWKVTLFLRFTVNSIASLIQRSPSVVVVALIPVIPVVRLAIFNITIPVYIGPAMSSYRYRYPGTPDKDPWTTIIIGAIPVALIVQVVPVIVVDYIVRTTDGS